MARDAHGNSTGSPVVGGQSRLAPAPLLSGAAALLITFAVFQQWPQLEVSVLARLAARGAALLSGSTVLPDSAGFALPDAAVPVVVTAACSAADFCGLVAALIAWHVARRGRSPAVALVSGLALAIPVGVGVNALRIVAVAHLHRWVLPHVSAAYGPFLHLTIGVAVFLPALIALHLVLAFHGNRPPAAAG